MPPSVPDKIACSTAKDLRYALDPLRPLIEQIETEENWDKISRAIQTIAALARGGAAELDVEYVKELRNFSAMILNSMNSERTRLANVAVDLFTVIAPPLGNKLEPLISIFIPTLIKLLGRTNKVFVSRAKAGLQAIISNCPHPRILIELRVMITDKSAPLRVIVAGAVLQCLSEWDWSMPSFAAKVGEIETVVRAVGTDSNVDARKIARQIFDLYKQMFPDRVDDFLEPLTPVIKRYLDIKPKAGSASGTRKPAPVPAPRFHEPRAPAAPAPAPVSAPPIQEVFELPAEPSRPKMTRVGASRSGPSRAPVAEPGSSTAPPMPIHSRVVSGPERVATQTLRDRVEATMAGPMRAALPSTMSIAPPVVRSISASGPSRMRVDPPSATAHATALPSVDSLDSSQPAAGPARRFRPARAAMDPSQMPQRVAVAPPSQKPSLEPRKMEGPSRVNVARSVSATVPVVSHPARVASTAVRPERDLKSSMTMPAPPGTHQTSVEPTPAASASLSASMPPPALPTVYVPAPALPAPEPAVVEIPIPSPTAVPIPASAPVSRSTSVAPSDSRPPSVASTAPTSKVSSTIASTSTKPTTIPAPAPPTAPAKPALVSSKSAPIATKVSALLKRGNPNAPPPFVPKRAVATANGGVGAATVSQMARQREAIAAREKRETEEAATKARREPAQRKDGKAKEVPHKEKEEKASEPVATKSVRSKPASSSSQSQPTKTGARAVPAAPKKATGSVRSKPQGGPPRVNVKELAPDMVAPVCAPLPGSPTPLKIREVPLPVSPKEEPARPEEREDVEQMQLDDAEEMMEHEPIATVEPAVEVAVNEQAPVEESPTVEEVEMEDELTSEADPVDIDPVKEPVQTPVHVTQSSVHNQTAAAVEPIPATLPSAGFAFHPQLAHLMTLAPQPSQEMDDFLVDLSSPPPKERPTEETVERPALGERGNTHAYVSQFHQDLMMLSGL